MEAAFVSRPTPTINSLRCKSQVPILPVAAAVTDVASL